MRQLSENIQTKMQVLQGTDLRICKDINRAETCMVLEGFLEYRKREFILKAGHGVAKRSWRTFGAECLVSLNTPNCVLYRYRSTCRDIHTLLFNQE